MSKIDAIIRPQLVLVGKHFGIDVTMGTRKIIVRRYLLEYYVDDMKLDKAVLAEFETKSQEQTKFDQIRFHEIGECKC